MSRNNIEKVIVYFISSFSFLLVLFYILYLSLGYYHSDCVDSILWADAALQGKGMINPEFRYAAIMPLGGQLFFMPFVAIFGFTTKAQILGIVLFYICFAASILFMCYAMKLEVKWSFGIMAFVIILVATSEKLREIFYGHIIYYSLGLLFLFVGIGLVFLFLEEWKKNKEKKNNKNISNNKKLIIFGVILFIWTAICATNGMQVLALYSFPLLGALVGVCFLDFKNKFLDNINLNKYAVAVVLLASTAAGLEIGRIICNGVESGYEKAYSGFSLYTEWSENFNSMFPKLFMLLGVETTQGITLFSMDGIINLVRIGFGIMVVVTPIIMLFFYRKFNEQYRIFLLTHHILAIIILSGWTFGKLGAANWRLSPILVTGAVLNILFVRWILKNKDCQRWGVLMMIPMVILVVVTSVNLLKLEDKNSNVTEITELIETLEDNNLEYGYGTFWNAGITTLLSDSKVKVRNINIDESGIHKYLYQTNDNWYENATGYDKYFVVMTHQEYMMYVNNMDRFEKADEILESSSFKILVYNHNIFGFQ